MFLLPGRKRPVRFAIAAGSTLKIGDVINLAVSGYGSDDEFYPFRVTSFTRRPDGEMVYSVVPDLGGRG